jgi:hypothetical protein
MDNDGFTDAMVFGFSAAIDLASVKIGYPTGTASGNCGVSGFTCDSDITVLAYTGSGNPTTNGNLANLTYSQLLTHGWALVGNYADVAGLPNSTATVVNSTGYNYWLVSAYNTPISGSALSGGNDYVKVLALSGDKTKQTPEPATMLLVGSAAAAGFWVRRRRRILPRTVEIC